MSRVAFADSAFAAFLCAVLTVFAVLASITGIATCACRKVGVCRNHGDEAENRKHCPESINSSHSTPQWIELQA